MNRMEQVPAARVAVYIVIGLVAVCFAELVLPRMTGLPPLVWFAALVAAAWVIVAGVRAGAGLVFDRIAGAATGAIGTDDR